MLLLAGVQEHGNLWLSNFCCANFQIYISASSSLWPLSKSSFQKRSQIKSRMEHLYFELRFNHQISSCPFLNLQNCFWLFKYIKNLYYTPSSYINVKSQSNSSLFIFYVFSIMDVHRDIVNSFSGLGCGPGWSLSCFWASVGCWKPGKPGARGSDDHRGKCW